MKNKTRNILILTCLLLAGCVLSMPRDAWITEMYKQPLGDISEAENPGMHRCLGDNPADVSTEINDLYRSILLENEKSFAKVIDYNLQQKYIADMRVIVIDRVDKIMRERMENPAFAAKNKAACDKALRSKL